MLSFLYSQLFIDFFTLIILIITGATLRHKKIITEDKLEFINSLILSVMLPCFILSAFMKDLNSNYISSGINIIIWAILIHIILYTIGIVFYKNFQKQLSEDEQTALISMLPLGNITFYGVPITNIAYGMSGVFVANLYAIINRTILNTFVLATMSGTKFNKNDLIKLFKNPALQTTIFGAMIFFLQDVTPQITIGDKTASIFRIDHTLPFIFKAIKSIGGTLSVFAWLIIGASITGESIKTIIRSPYSIIFALQKTIVIPFIGISVYILLHRYMGFEIDHQFLPATLLLLVTPVANTLVIFAFKYKRAPMFCIACMVTSTIFSLLFFPFYKLLFEWLIQQGII